MTIAQLEQELISKAKRIDKLEEQNAKHRELHDKHEDQLTKQSEGDYEYFDKHNDFILCQSLMNKNADLVAKIEGLERQISYFDNQNHIKDMQLLKEHIVKLSMRLKL